VHFAKIDKHYQYSTEVEAFIFAKKRAKT